MKYVKHGAALDFVIYYKFNKQPILLIEVDEFAFHENNPEQLKKDKLKNSILSSYELPFMRLSTNGSGEAQKIRDRLDVIL